MWKGLTIIALITAGIEWILAACSNSPVIIGLAFTWQIWFFICFYKWLTIEKG